MTKISDPFTPDEGIRRWRRHGRSRAVAAAGFLFLQGCATTAPSCDGHFEPINRVAPVQERSIEEGVSTGKEHRS